MESWHCTHLFMSQHANTVSAISLHANTVSAMSLHANTVSAMSLHANTVSAMSLHANTVSASIGNATFDWCYILLAGLHDPKLPRPKLGVGRDVFSEV